MGGNKINYSSQSSGDESTDFNFWVSYLLSKPNLSVAPVSSFPHAPLSCLWNSIAPSNIIVEKKLNLNLETDALSEGCTEDAENSHWLARVISYSGYFAKVVYERYEEIGFGATSFKQSDRHYDSWANFCTDIQRVGYCALNKFPLVPPQLAVGNYSRISPNAWHFWFMEKVTGAVSKDSHVGRLLKDHFQDQLEVGTTVECLDLNNTSRMRVAKVKKVVGHRVFVKYWDADKMNRNYVKSFWASWAHQNSDLIYPAGWSKAVGQEIRAPPNYEPPELLPTHSSLSKGLGLDHIDIQIGMKLEAVNVFEPSMISTATVVKVLKYGYFMVRIDSNSNNSKSRNINSWFCFHLTSPVIFPCGWCKSHKIDLVPPSREISGTNQHFNWKTYFEKTGTKPLPLHELPKKENNHSFAVGMKLEAVDQLQPVLICVATISRIVAGCLLRIHFDAWNEMYDNWVPVTSTDIYPIGYCQLTGYTLQTPPTAVSSSSNRRTNKSILVSNNN